MRGPPCCRLKWRLEALRSGSRPADMPMRTDPLRLILQVGIYIFFYILFLAIFVFTGIFAWTGLLAGAALSTFIPALATNVLTSRIYEGRKFADIGMRWNRNSAWNAALGFGAGVISAAIVLATPLALGVAHLKTESANTWHWRISLFVMVILFFGAAGEEILFRGYGFQVLLRSVGPYAAIVPVGVVFGALHAANPNVSALGIANTVGFGILFGYAFFRSHDLWLPIGMHYGWNFTLPLFGSSVSGIKMEVTGYELQWSAGALWSGGDYGPEASILTSAVLFALFVFLWKAPVRQQRNALLDQPVET